MRQTISRSLVSLTVVIAVLVLFSPCGFAEDPSAQVLSLSDAITAALSKRAELQAAAQVEASSAQLRPQAGFIPNPRLFYQSENLRPDMNFTQNVDILSSQSLQASQKMSVLLNLRASTLPKTFRYSPTIHGVGVDRLRRAVGTFRNVIVARWACKLL